MPFPKAKEHPTIFVQTSNPNHMMKLDTLKKVFSASALALVAMALVPSQTMAQCTTWVNPSPTGGWSDFNTTFGGAPCDDGSGCPFNEIQDFEIWADEAYAMNDVAMGGTYTFSACNSTGGTAWDIEFTIVAPSGAVDASGLDAGSICELTWTASETGTYLIVVSEVGACGNSSNDATDNGFPAITCVSSPETQCGASSIEEVAAGTFVRVSPNPSNGIFMLNVTGQVNSIDVYDLNGRQIEALGITGVNNGTYTLDMSAYEAGTYIVRSLVNGVQEAQRITLVK